ncbi:MAG: VTT domain-containing protein [Candidatus Jorgensenbacteria bacterium]|nr:VTT domain-containing protein [Candidatus Jorgensenbacteria bacterium]
MESLIQTITPLVATYGVLGVFFLSLIEEIVAPIPSSLVLMAAGFFLIPHGLSFGEIALPALLNVVLPASVGLTIGALFIYSVAYLGGKPLVVRWGRLFGITWQKLEEAEARFTKGRADEIIIFGLRAVPITPNFLISAICGLVRYPIKAFIVLTFLGSVTRAILMGFIGWSVGTAYVQYAAQLSTFTNLMAALIIALLVGLALFIFLRRKFRL